MKKLIAVVLALCALLSTFPVCAQTNEAVCGLYRLTAGAEAVEARYLHAAPIDAIEAFVEGTWLPVDPEDWQQVLDLVQARSTRTWTEGRKTITTANGENYQEGVHTPTYRFHLAVGGNPYAAAQMALPSNGAGLVRLDPDKAAKSRNRVHGPDCPAWQDVFGVDGWLTEYVRPDGVHTFCTAASAPKQTPKATAKPAKPTARPTVRPTTRPTVRPTARPTAKPTARPTAKPTAKPTKEPKATPRISTKPWTPDPTPTLAPTAKPTKAPRATPRVTAKPKTTAKPTATPAPDDGVPGTGGYQGWSF